MNPKTLQYIMGHADISVTLNTYTHVNFDDVKGNCIEWRTLKKPIGKAAYFPNVFTNFAGENMRKYKTI